MTLATSAGVASVALLFCAMLLRTHASPTRPSSIEEAKLRTRSVTATKLGGERLDESWRVKWERGKRELRSDGEMVAARAGTLEVLPFMSDGDGFYFKIHDRKNPVFDLQILGGDRDNPTAKTIERPNFAGRELIAVEIDHFSRATTTVVLAPFRGNPHDTKAIEDDLLLGINYVAGVYELDAESTNVKRVPLGDAALMLETGGSVHGEDHELIMWSIYNAEANVIIWYSVLGPRSDIWVERARALDPFMTTTDCCVSRGDGGLTDILADAAGLCLGHYERCGRSIAPR